MGNYRETFCRHPNSPPLPRPPEASSRISPCRESAKKEKKGEEEKLRRVEAKPHKCNLLQSLQHTVQDADGSFEKVIDIDPHRTLTTSPTHPQGPLSRKKTEFTRLFPFFTDPQTWILYLQNCPKRRKISERRRMWLVHIFLLGEFKTQAVQKLNLFWLDNFLWIDNFLWLDNVLWLDNFLLPDNVFMAG